MTGLARRLSLWNYFALGFGTMIGTGWVILMDDWLGRGGAARRDDRFFLLGGVLLLPIGYVYGQWVAASARCGGRGGLHRPGIPAVRKLPDGLDDAAGVFHRVPLGGGWRWESWRAYIFPRLDTMELYRVAGQPVFSAPIAGGDWADNLSFLP